MKTTITETFAGEKIRNGLCIQAGGPGSGRKPEFQSNDTKGLDRLHRSMVNGGYRYSHSVGTGSDFEHGSVRHIYYKGKGENKTKGVLVEKPDGRHRVEDPDHNLSYVK